MRSTHRATTASEPTSDRPGDRARTRPTTTEEIHLRNYDGDRSYRLTITVGDGEGEPVFRRTYHLQPGQTESVGGVLDPAVYDVTVELDGQRRRTAECRVDSSPGHTIHVELGNGIVSLTEGHYE